MKKVITTIILIMVCMSLHAVDRDSLRVFRTYPFMERGAFHTGASFAHTELNTRDAEFMLLLDGMDLSGHVTRINPFMSYTYAKDRAIGLSFKYMSADADAGSATLDLLNEGLQFSVNDMHASYRSSGFELFHRWFTGLDRLSRFGLYYDTTLGYTDNRTELYSETPSDSYIEGVKFSLGFTPGFMMFVMDNVAIHVGMNISTVSYNKLSVYDQGSVSGTRSSLRCQLKANTLGLVYGISIQL